MGKVIKGSSASPGRYTVAVPVSVARPPQAEPAAGAAESSIDFDMLLPDGPLGVADEPAASPAEIDIDAVALQAQELIDDAARSAETLVEEARLSASEIVEEATQAAQALRDDIRREAHAEGYAGGEAAAHDEMTAMLETMRDLLESTRGERHTMLMAAEPELVRLAVAIAERVLHQQIALDNGVVVEMAKAAVARIVDREKITIRVNPADMDRMRGHRDELLALGDVKTMVVIEDQRVDRGGVIIETDAGSIDAKISTQLAEVRKILHIVDDVVVQPAPIAAVDGTDDLRAARAS